MLDLIRLRLAVDILEIEQFGNIGMDVDVMTAVDTGEPKPKRFRTGYCAPSASGAVRRLPGTA